MALLCFSSFTLTYLSSPFPSSSSSSSLPPVSRVRVKPIDLPLKSFSAVRILRPFSVKKTGAVIVRAAADGDGVDGAASAEEDGSPSEAEPESKKEVVPVEKLPLESKLKERQEQRLRMKLARKIRLKRKRLVRKRRLRKKGRWPPSKMKKLKNV